MQDNPIKLPRRTKDLTGKVFGTFTVMNYTGRQKSHLYWNCSCCCGQLHVIRADTIRSGKVKKCKCEEYSRKPEFYIWSSMKQRCDINNRNFKNYAGRGITVCEEWQESFEAFFAHVGPRPSPKHSIDRIDNNKGYFPGNVRWATITQNARNKRTNRLVVHKGTTNTLIEWAEDCGIPYKTLWQRLSMGWPFEKAIGTAVNHSAGRFELGHQPQWKTKKRKATV